jgi:hypothetical protein
MDLASNCRTVLQLARSYCKETNGEREEERESEREERGKERGKRGREGESETHTPRALQRLPQLHLTAQR